MAKKPVSASRARARRAALAMLGGSTQAEALAAAGYRGQKIGQATRELIKEEFHKCLDEALPPKLFAEKLLSVLNAKKPVAVMDGRGNSHVELVDDPHATVKALELAARIGGLIVRHVEGRVDHNHRLGDEIARARQRVKRADVTAVVTHQLPPAAESTTCENEIGQTLGHQPNMPEKSD